MVVVTLEGTQIERSTFKPDAKNFQFLSAFLKSLQQINFAGLRIGKAQSQISEISGGKVVLPKPRTSYSRPWCGNRFVFSAQSANRNFSSVNLLILNAAGAGEKAHSSFEAATSCSR